MCTVCLLLGVRALQVGISVVRSEGKFSVEGLTKFCPYIIHIYVQVQTYLYMSQLT